MKKLIFFLCAMLISVAAWSKDHKPAYYETHDPSPDSLMVGFQVQYNGGVYTISGVDSVRGATAQQLFTKIKDWISTVYREPDKVIITETSPSLLVFEGRLCNNINGRVIFRFRDGRYRIEISSLEELLSTSLFKNLYYSSRPIEKNPRYDANRMPRSGMWLLADVYEYLNRIKNVAHRTERKW